MRLEKSDKVMIAVCLALFYLGSLAAWSGWGPIALILSLGFVFGVMVAIEVEIYRRNQLQYRHMQFLFSLFSVLKINAPLPLMAGWAIPPDFATTIVSLILEYQPRRVLELGSGTSTLIAAYALKTAGKGGTMVSFEQKPLFAARSEENIKKHGLQDIATIRVAPIKETSLQGQTWHWYDTAALTGIDGIDLLIVDGPANTRSRQMRRYPALPVLFPLLSTHAVVLVDDAQRRDIRQMVGRWRAEFPTFSYEALDSEQGIVILRRQATEAIELVPA